MSTKQLATMPRNHRLPATITCSISWRFDVLAAIDTRCAELFLDRSTLVSGALEHLLGLRPHPDIVGRRIAFVADVDKPWLKLAQEYERKANQDRETKRKHRARGREQERAERPGGLVRRPAVR